MKPYLIIAYLVLFICGLTYIVETERKMSNLRNELLISKANEEQQKIEINNNKVIITSLNKQITKMNAIEKQKQEKIKETAEKISAMSAQEKINVINNVFNDF